jgi:hypothetical protein
MPTSREPSNTPDSPLPQSNISSCPPESPATWQMAGAFNEVDRVVRQQLHAGADNAEGKRMDVDDEVGVAVPVFSPISMDGDKQEDTELPALSSTHSPSMGYEFSNVRVSPSAILPKPY